MSRLLLMAALLEGCGGTENGVNSTEKDDTATYEEVDSGSTEGDADTDGDGDSDADTGGDTDTDTNGDTNTDSDTGVEPVNDAITTSAGRCRTLLENDASQISEGSFVDYESAPVVDSSGILNMQMVGSDSTDFSHLFACAQDPYSSCVYGATAIHNSTDGFDVQMNLTAAEPDSTDTTETCAYEPSAGLFLVHRIGLIDTDDAETGNFLGWTTSTDNPTQSARSMYIMDDDGDGDGDVVNY